MRPSRQTETIWQFCTIWESDRGGLPGWPTALPRDILGKCAIPAAREIPEHRIARLKLRDVPTYRFNPSRDVGPRIWCFGFRSPAVDRIINGSPLRRCQSPAFTDAA